MALIWRGNGQQEGCRNVTGPGKRETLSGLRAFYMVGTCNQREGRRDMQLRERVNSALKQAMKDRAGDRLCTLRLINAAIKDRDIAARGEGSEEGVGEGEVLAILGKMVKQRQESARVYEEGGRIDLAQQELEEIEVIEEFLPKQLSDKEVDSAIDEAVNAIGANSIRDMGKIMGHLKSKYTGQMDFGAAGSKVKQRLAS